MLSITRHQIDYADRANHMLAELDCPAVGTIGQSFDMLQQ